MEEQTTQFPTIKDIPDSEWKKLSEKKIYFGHQSVGFNIINGIKDLMKQNPQIKLNIVETSDPSEFNTPLFAHSRVGTNKEPNSKIHAFSEDMKGSLGEMTDIAFFKFCYVDVMSGTNPLALFTTYRNTMQALKEAFPDITFIHVTVPLRIVQRGPKAWIKKIIGRAIGGYSDNIKRNMYNAFLRQEYQGKEPIFNLAKIESTFPDGTRSSFKKDGEEYHCLVAAYTNDGGHLNGKGRKIVAEQLLVFLAGLR